MFTNTVFWPCVQQRVALGVVFSITSCSSAMANFKCTSERGSTQVFGRIRPSCDARPSLKATQSALFEAVVPTVRATFQGFNATLLTYGQTGSGKTHTLLGSDTDPGIAPRAVQILAERASSNKSMKISMSMVELYCEKLQDLIDPCTTGLTIHRSDMFGVHVTGACIKRVCTAESMLAVIKAGLQQRVVRSTGMNAESSRSHLLIFFYLQQTGDAGDVMFSKLCFADLAGSERQSKAQTASSALVEGCAINKSLSALGNVLTALSEDARASHVPFRDSKLTRLLQDCLAGNALMTLIVCMSPDPEHVQETVSTLRFGSRALGIDNVVTINKQVSVEALVAERERLTNLVMDLRTALDNQSHQDHHTVQHCKHAPWPAVLDFAILAAVGLQTIYLLLQ